MASSIEFLGLLAIAFVPTVLGAISGIGGGIIIKPVLDAVSSFDTEEINFLSGCTVLAMSFVTLFKDRIGKIKLDDKRGTILAMGTVFGGSAGKFIFLTIISGAQGELVRSIQTLILILLCFAVLLYIIKKDSIKQLEVNNLFVCFLLGITLGIISAFIGIGGGPINIMVISYFLGMDSKTAGRYSIYAVFLAQAASLGSTIISGRVPIHLFPALIVMVIGGISGGFIGSLIKRKLKNNQVDIFFRFILTGVIIILAINLVR